MHYSVFPLRELRRGGTYAIFATEAGKMELVNIKPDKGRLFKCKFGQFQLNKKYRYQLGKSDVYFYDQKGFNPLDISALTNIRDYLRTKRKDEENEMKNTPLLTEYEIALITNKFQDYLQTSPFVRRTEDNMPILTDDAFRLQDLLLDKLDDNTRMFLEDYFEEDEVAQTNKLARIPQEMRFRDQSSPGLMSIMPQNTMNKRNLALVVINNRILDMVPVTTRQDEKSGKMLVMHEKYGNHVVKETKTRYRHGKTNIFIIGVKTVEKKVIEEAKQELVQIAEGTQEVKEEEQKPLTAEDVIGILRDFEEQKKEKKKKNGKATGIENGNGKGNGKFKRFKPSKKDIDPITGNPKEGELAVDFEPIKSDKDYAETISINATTFLPKVVYIDPMMGDIRVKVTQNQKTITDLLGGPIGKKLPISPILVLMLLVGTAIGSVIVWQQIVEPQLAKMEQQRFQELLQQQQQQQGGGNPPVTGTPGPGGSEIFDIPNPFGGILGGGMVIPLVVH